MEQRHGHHHYHYAARSIILAMTDVFINVKENFMQVNLTWTTPSTRIDGTPLALTDIQATNVFRNGSVVGSPITVSGAMMFTDISPLTGSNDYEVETVTIDGLVSAPSNIVTIVVMGRDS